MLNKIIFDLSSTFKDIIINPTKLFRKIEQGSSNSSIFVLFFISLLITFVKSFSKSQNFINFFSNENLNKILSFISIPQARWAITLLSFALSVYLIGIFCNLFLKRYNKKLISCILSISSVGILLHLFFFIMYDLLSQKSIYLLRSISFIWVMCLSISAIKNTQNASYMESILVFVLSILPAILIIGLPGFAPYLLWLGSE